MVALSVGQIVLHRIQARAFGRRDEEYGVAQTGSQFAEAQRFADGNTCTTQLHRKLQRIDRTSLQAPIGNRLENIDVTPCRLQPCVDTRRVQAVKPAMPSVR